MSYFCKLINSRFMPNTFQYLYCRHQPQRNMLTKIHTKPQKSVKKSKRKKGLRPPKVELIKVLEKRISQLGAGSNPSKLKTSTALPTTVTYREVQNKDDGLTNTNVQIATNLERNVQQLKEQITIHGGPVNILKNERVITSSNKVTLTRDSTLSGASMDDTGIPASKHGHIHDRDSQQLVLYRNKSRESEKRTFVNWSQALKQFKYQLSKYKQTVGSLEKELVGCEVTTAVSSSPGDIEPANETRHSANPTEATVDDTTKDMKDMKDAAKDFSKQISKKKATKAGKAILMSKMNAVAVTGVISNKILKAYVDACVSSNLVQKAHNTVVYYHDASKRSDRKMKPSDVDIFNMLMHGWAKQPKIGMSRMLNLLGIMKEANVKPNLQSCAAFLEHFGRNHKISDEVANQVLSVFTEQGLKLDEIPARCKLSGDEKKYVTQAMRRFPTSGEECHNHKASGFGYDLPLLAHLNDEPDPSQMVEINSNQGVINRDSLREFAEEQVQMEAKQHISVPSVLTTPSEMDKDNKVKEMRHILESAKKAWRRALMFALTSHKKFLAEETKGIRGINWHPFLSLLNPEKYVDIMMNEIQSLMEGSGNYNPPLKTLYAKLGYLVMNTYSVQYKLNKDHVKSVLNLYDHYAADVCADDRPVYRNQREAWQRIQGIHNEGPDLDISHKNWPLHIAKGVGKLLYAFIINDVRIDGNMFRKKKERKFIPAFYVVVSNHDVISQKELTVHPSLFKLYHGARVKELIFESRYLPMLAPPLPWISTEYGGYMLATTKIVRFPYLAQEQEMMLHDTPVQQLYPVFDALNALSACPWIINKPVLDLIIDVFRSGGDVDLDVPPPATQGLALPQITKNMTKEEHAQVYRQKMKLIKEKAEIHSLWCSGLYKLSIANLFRDRIFWFPHNMDFRGRIYPCPPHFNHLGGDVVRGMLLFAKGKPLGAKGLDWLKIHLTNLTGLRKRSSNAERLKYANEIMDSILDSADNPMNGTKWWQASDEPWQTLACCMEIAKATRSPNHESYICHFPVHQDGSCNGLQHYAALGRDQAGAESVNLFPYDAPRDVYSDVAELVEKARAEDEQNGVEIAKILKGFVRRKVIKQTVMTTVYGVTQYGAKLQILRQLRDIPEMSEEYCWPASFYLTEKTFKSLKEMFTSTRNIQDWLTLVAQMVAVVRDKPMDWVTPLGLPVIQPYHKKRTIDKQENSTKFKVDMLLKPDSIKQRNAFPPNFIHSLDSTHVMLTALNCMRKGITFVSVHDCYWTHPPDVDVMNKVCREQFVELHNQPILQDLSRYLLDKFSFQPSEPVGIVDQEIKEFFNSVLAKVPEQGDFNLNRVLESKYFFS